MDSEWKHFQLQFFKMLSLSLSLNENIVLYFLYKIILLC